MNNLNVFSKNMDQIKRNIFWKYYNYYETQQLLIICQKIMINLQLYEHNLFYLHIYFNALIQNGFYLLGSDLGIFLYISSTKRFYKHVVSHRTLSLGM